MWLIEIIKDKVWMFATYLQFKISLEAFNERYMLKNIDLPFPKIALNNLTHSFSAKVPTLPSLTLPSSLPPSLLPSLRLPPSLPPSLPHICICTYLHLVIPDGTAAILQQASVATSFTSVRTFVIPHLQ